MIWSVVRVEPYLPFKPPRVQLSLLSSYRARHTVSGERLFRRVRVFSHHPLSISKSLHQSRSANLRHEPARATPLSNTQELCRSCCAKPPEVHVATFLILSSRESHSVWSCYGYSSDPAGPRGKKESWTCTRGRSQCKIYQNNWLLVWICKRDSLLTSNLAASERTSTLCFTQLHRNTLT